MKVDKLMTEFPKIAATFEKEVLPWFPKEAVQAAWHAARARATEQAALPAASANSTPPEAHRSSIRVSWPEVPISTQRRISNLQQSAVVRKDTS